MNETFRKKWLARLDFPVPLNNKQQNLQRKSSVSENENRESEISWSYLLIWRNSSVTKMFLQTLNRKLQLQNLKCFVAAHSSENTISSLSLWRIRLKIFYQKANASAPTPTVPAWFGATYWFIFQILGISVKSYNFESHGDIYENIITVLKAQGKWFSGRFPTMAETLEFTEVMQVPVISSDR
jgi:hypothetical protein